MVSVCALVEKKSSAVNDVSCLTVNAGSAYPCHASQDSIRLQATELTLLFVPRMLQVIVAHEEHFGSARVQQAQQQQAWLADLQAGLLSGHCFQRFLSQRCGVNSQVHQVCGHQAFSQAVSGMIRCLSFPLLFE